MNNDIKMTCDRVGEHLLERAGGQLDKPTAGELEEHLASCGVCRREAERLEETWSMLERFGEEPAGEGVRTRFYAMLDEQCREEQRIRERGGPVAT